MPVQQLSLMFGDNIDELSHLSDPDICGAHDLDIEVHALPSPHHAFSRLAYSDEGDGGEMSFAFHAHLTANLGQDHRFVAIPVFCHREFPETYLHVSEQSGIRDLSELRGGVVGLREYGMAMSVWLRGHLLHGHGIEPQEISWRIVRDGDIREYPDGVDVARDGDADLRTFFENLAAGRLDAFLGQFHAEFPEGVTPLFRDRQPILDYYTGLGIVPIVHIVVLRRELVDRDLTIARRLLDACVDSQRRWIDERDIAADSGIVGPLPYGIEANRPTLDAFARYMTEQRLVSRPVSVGELFLPIEPG